MAIKQRTYTMDDLVEQDLKTAPTLDLPAFKTEKVYVPKDGGNLIVFFANAYDMLYIFFRNLVNVNFAV